MATLNNYGVHTLARLSTVHLSTVVFALALLPLGRWRGQRNEAGQYHYIFLFVACELYEVHTNTHILFINWHESKIVKIRSKRNTTTITTTNKDNNNNHE